MEFVLTVQHVTNWQIATTSLLCTSFCVIEAELLRGKWFGSKTPTHLRNFVKVLEALVMMLPGQPLSLRTRDAVISEQIPWASMVRKNIMPSHLYFLLPNLLSIKEVWFQKRAITYEPHAERRVKEVLGTKSSSRYLRKSGLVPQVKSLNKNQDFWQQ